jgi:hypothetical protein
MSFPSNATANRKVALLCARLFIQCVVGSFDTQIGADEAICLTARDVPAVRSMPDDGWPAARTDSRPSANDAT